MASPAPEHPQDQRPLTLPPSPPAVWDRAAREWHRYLAGTGHPAGEVEAVVVDALGPRPGAPVELAPDAPEVRPERAAGVVLPAFRWADRVPLPPERKATGPDWPHPLGIGVPTRR